MSEYKSLSGTPLLLDSNKFFSGTPLLSAKKFFSGTPLLSAKKFFSGTPLLLKSGTFFSGTPLILKQEGEYKSFSGYPLLLWK
jgi:hypothetical protein